MQTKYEVRLNFEAIKLPPVTDILVSGSNYQHGKLGIFESLRFLAPDQYEAHDVSLEDFPNVGTVFYLKEGIKANFY